MIILGALVSIIAIITLIPMAFIGLIIEFD